MRQFRIFMAGLAHHQRRRSPRYRGDVGDSTGNKPRGTLLFLHILKDVGGGGLHVEAVEQHISTKPVWVSRVSNPLVPSIEARLKPRPAVSPHSEKVAGSVPTRLRLSGLPSKSRLSGRCQRCSAVPAITGQLVHGCNSAFAPTWLGKTPAPLSAGDRNWMEDET